MDGITSRYISRDFKLSMADLWLIWERQDNDISRDLELVNRNPAAFGYWNSTLSVLMSQPIYLKRDRNSHELMSPHVLLFPCQHKSHNGQPGHMCFSTKGTFALADESFKKFHYDIDATIDVHLSGYGLSHLSDQAVLLKTATREDMITLGNIIQRCFICPDSREAFFTLISGRLFGMVRDYLDEYKGGDSHLPWFCNVMDGFRDVIDNY